MLGHWPIWNSARETVDTGKSCQFKAIITTIGVKVAMKNINTFPSTTDAVNFTFINVCEKIKTLKPAQLIKM